ncbi:hypothetical protein [Alteromonas sp. AMM-1]|jgi:hypothetical protein|uniref:hypothetical protein n=1 Tax=Alteromonas sp. AMM-1 TaxID=3394233 RepID=UPI0039A472A0
MNLPLHQTTSNVEQPVSGRVVHKALLPEYLTVGLLVECWNDALDSAAALLGSTLGNAGIKLKIISAEELIRPNESLAGMVGLILSVHDKTDGLYVPKLAARLANYGSTVLPDCTLLSCIDTSDAGKRADVIRCIEAQILARQQRWQWIGLPGNRHSDGNIVNWMRSVCVQCRAQANQKAFAM